MLTIDVGTSVVRVTAVTLSGAFVASARATCRPLVSGDRAVLDATALWLDLGGLIREVVAQAGPPIAIGVSCLLGTVLVDAALEPVAATILWQDRRAAAEAAELDRLLAGRARMIAGRGVSPELTAPRLLWMARHEPVAWAGTRWILSLKDFVVAKLTGAVATDGTSASYTLLFDVRERAWSTELAAAADVPMDRLPPVLGAHAAAGVVAGAGAAALGIPSGTPVAVGGPDGSVAALGCGAVRSGITSDVAGSTDVLLHLTDRPILDPEDRSILNASLMSGLWTVGGPTGLTGGTVAWLCGILGHASVDDAYRSLGRALAAIPPGAGGVTVHTAMTGERFPTWSSDRSGSIGGLRPEHTAAHLLRAAEEGAAFAVREGLQALAALGLDIATVRISGGTTRRRESMQLRADACQVSVVAVATPEATTIGAAMLAAVSVGAFPDLDEAASEMVALTDAVNPEPAAAAAYNEAYVRWQAGRLPTVPPAKHRDV